MPPKGKKEKQDEDDKPKQLGGLDAAAIVLKEAGTAMNTKQMWAAIDARKLWWSERDAIRDFVHAYHPRDRREGEGLALQEGRAGEVRVLREERVSP